MKWKLIPFFFGRRSAYSPSNHFSSITSAKSSTTNAKWKIVSQFQWYSNSSQSDSTPELFESMCQAAEEVIHQQKLNPHQMSLLAWHFFRSDYTKIKSKHIKLQRLLLAVLTSHCEKLSPLELHRLLRLLVLHPEISRKEWVQRISLQTKRIIHHISPSLLSMLAEDFALFSSCHFDSFFHTASQKIQNTTQITSEALIHFFYAVSRSPYLDLSLALHVDSFFLSHPQELLSCSSDLLSLLCRGFYNLKIKPSEQFLSLLYSSLREKNLSQGSIKELLLVSSFSVLFDTHLTKALHWISIVVQRLQTFQIRDQGEFSFPLEKEESLIRERDDYLVLSDLSTLYLLLSRLALSKNDASDIEEVMESIVCYLTKAMEEISLDAVSPPYVALLASLISKFPLKGSHNFPQCAVPCPDSSSRPLSQRRCELEEEKLVTELLSADARPLDTLASTVLSPIVHRRINERREVEERMAEDVLDSITYTVGREVMRKSHEERDGIERTLHRLCIHLFFKIRSLPGSILVKYIASLHSINYFLYENSRESPRQEGLSNLRAELERHRSEAVERDGKKGKSLQEDDRASDTKRQTLIVPYEKALLHQHALSKVLCREILRRLDEFTPSQLLSSLLYLSSSPTFSLQDIRPDLLPFAANYLHTQSLSSVHKVAMGRLLHTHKEKSGSALITEVASIDAFLKESLDAYYQRQMA